MSLNRIHVNLELAKKEITKQIKEYITKQFNEKISKLEQKAKEEELPILYIAKNESPEIIQALIDNGADVNAKFMASLYFMK